jgi:hypothetical protein
MTRLSHPENAFSRDAAQLKALVPATSETGHPFLRDLVIASLFQWMTKRNYEKYRV